MYISSEISKNKNKEFLNDIEYWAERPCKSAGAFVVTKELYFSIFTQFVHQRRKYALFV